MHRDKVVARIFLTIGYVEIKKQIIYNDKRDASKTVVLSTQITRGQFKARRYGNRCVRERGAIYIGCYSVRIEDGNWPRVQGVFVMMQQQQLS